MFCRVVFFLLLFTMFFSASAGERVLTVIDTSDGSMGLQKFFGRIFEKNNTLLPQELEINTVTQYWDEIKNIPPETVVISDGLTMPELPAVWEEKVYACQPLVVAVHKDNPLDDLDIAVLKRIFSGRAGDWSRIGGRNGKIKLAGCDPKSGIGRAFRKLVMQQKLQKNEEVDITDAIAPDMIVYNSLEAASALLQTSENIILFGGGGLLKNPGNKYKILKIGNVFPSRENIFTCKYKLSASHRIIYCKDAPPASVKTLLEFLYKSSALTPDLLAVRQ